jgi:anaerobic selenocysteine-containing dehydrogenase
MAATKTVKSMCRICVVHCGLLVTTECDQVIDIQGDPDHGVSHGYVCPKGRALRTSQHDPNRLDYASIGRGAERRRVTPEEMVDDLGRRLAEIRDEHGPDAIAFFYGTAAQLDSAGGSLGFALAPRLGTRSVYTTNSLDSIGRRTALRMMSGRSPLFPTFDFRGATLMAFFGINPPLSHGHTWSFPDPISRIREVARRGEVWVFDPRRSEAASHATRHVPLRPGSDHAVLAYTIRELLFDGADQEYIEKWTDRVDVLREVVAPFTLERAADIADVDPSDLTDFVAAVRRHRRLSALTGTGIGFSPNPTVTEWLVMALHGVTGSIERSGGLWFNPGFWTKRDEEALSSLGPQATQGALADEPDPGPPSRPDLQSWLQGQRPSAGLVDEIESGNVKALVVLGGNPLTLAPSADRVLQAFRNIETLAVADVIEDDMTEVATHVFPSASQFERADCNLVDQLQLDVFGQYTEAVVPLQADRRPLWWLVVELARRLGIQMLPDEVDAHPSDRAILEHVIFRDPRMPFDEVVASPGGVLVDVERDAWYTEHALPARQWNLAPPRLVEALADLEELPRGLVMVSRRQRFHMNTVHRDIEQPRTDEAVLFMNPDDAADHGLDDGDTVIVRSEAGCLTIGVRIDGSMRRGAAAIPHGYRNTNVNAITDDRRLLDAITGMPRYSTIPITLEKVDAA